jgi:Protein of unknown function (DUF3617)
MTQFQNIRRIFTMSLLMSGCVAGQAFAAPVDMPARKAGLWEITIDHGGGRMPAQTIQHCTDAATEKDMAATFSPIAKDTCSKQDMQKTTTGMVIDSTCQIGAMTSVSHMEITGDFNSAYTMKMTSQNSGGPAIMPKETSTTMQAKWIGACKPDQKPGDMVMPGGVKINIKDMQKMRPPAPK